MKAIRLALICVLIPSIGAAMLYANKKASSAIVDLGTLGGHESYAAAINNVGDVVGRSNTALGDSRAFLWRQGHMMELPMLPSADGGASAGVESDASDINNSGAIVGNCDTGVFEYNGNEREVYHAVSWTNGAANDLGVLPGYRCSTAQSVNDAGVIVGLSINESHGPRGYDYEEHLAVFTPGKTPHRLGSKLYARNIRGDVVDALRDSHATAIRFTTNKASRILADIKLPDYPVNLQINDSGQVVATVAKTVVPRWDGDAVSGSYVLAWLHGSLPTQLSSFPDYPNAYAYGINNMGEIVGKVTNRSNDHLSSRGVLWRGEGVMDLTETYANWSGWKIQNATGINDHGFIVGWGIRGLRL
ncbi:MAG: hypothetical protein ABIY70_22555, partial [Capsulimonas sp.]|uniref:hypothetical protein n=1 Tax=Capsulimonas sp. TaxID=2494211 RepID=UPI0032636765